jgi:phage terminase large subunit GpA-like protein
LEITFIGWDKEGIPYALGHEVIWGRYDDHATWSELDVALGTQWDHPLGGKIKVDATCIDSSDGETMETVYRYAFPRFRRRVFAIKGVGGNRPWIEKSKSTVKGGKLFIVGVDGIKSHIFGRLARASSMRFSKSLPDVLVEQARGRATGSQIFARTNGPAIRSGARATTRGSRLHGLCLRRSPDGECELGSPRG